MSRIAVVGGGIVGLASALKLHVKNKKFKITVFEKEDRVGSHQTGHNSGVIHAGLYYKPGSYKAKLCTDGRKQLVQFCEENEIPFEVCGKIVVACNESEIPRLNVLSERGKQNGIESIRILKKEEIADYEPSVSGVAALWVPATGIVNYQKVAEKMAALLKANGAELMLQTRVEGLRKQEKKWIVQSDRGDFEFDFLLNCAGLYSDRVLEMAGARPRIKIIPFRGEYYELKPSRQSLVRNLIYPVPDPKFPFLGVHFTRMIGGGVECGPNAVLAMKREGYRKFDFNLKETLEIAAFSGTRRFVLNNFKYGLSELHRSLNKKRFCKSLQRLIPAVQEGDLAVGGSGVRAQAMLPDGSLVEDFAFDEDASALHVLNTPSPAATSSLAIGDEVASRVLKVLGD